MMIDLRSLREFVREVIVDSLLAWLTPAGEEV